MSGKEPLLEVVVNTDEVYLTATAIQTAATMPPATTIATAVDMPKVIAAPTLRAAPTVTVSRRYVRPRVASRRFCIANRCI